MALDVDWQLWEGACNVASLGYFDENDTPPWDTWVAFVEDRSRERENGDYLLSWVPPAFSQHVNDGIDVSSTDALWWFGRGSTELEIVLRSRGLST